MSFVAVSGIGAGGLTPVCVYETLDGGGGGGETLRWAVDILEQTDPFTSGDLVIPLSQTPIDEGSLTVLSEGSILNPADYTILSGPDEVQIDFSANPATDAADGVWSFVIRYQYSV